MGLHLITGYAGAEHITSADQGSYNAAMMGNGQFVMERGNQFAASIISNNVIRVLDGDLMMQGRHVRMNENTYEELTFDNGAQGYKRNDLIVARYTKDSTTDKEACNLVVIKGAPSETTAVDPAHVTGNILTEHALQNDMPLFRVPFDGLNIQPLVQLFNTVVTWKTLQEQTVANVTKQVNNLVEQAENDVAKAIGQLITIDVQCDERLIGETVTITQGTKTFSKIVPASMKISFGVPTLGYWTLYNPVTKKNTYVATSYYGLYEVTLSCYKIYGVDIDFSMTNPATMCTYTDDAVGMKAGSSDWLSTQVFALLKNCILKNGAVLGYLKKGNLEQYEDDSTADITTLGNDVMLEIGGKIGYMIEWDASNTSKLHVKVTDNPNDSAFNYDAFSLDAYNDCDKIYIGVFKGFNSGSKIYSSSGRAATVSQTIDTFRTWCRARGTGYQQRSYASVKLMQCLYLIMYKSLNSQAMVGYGYVASGHRAGVSTGGTNAYGFNSEIIKASNPSYMTDQNHQVKCLGIEDFWGNYWEFVDGLCTDSSRNVLTCKCAKDFDTDGTGYDNNGNGGVSADLGNYMSRPQGGNKAGFTPKVVSGSDSTYFCDYTYLNASCLCTFGGNWDEAGTTGAFRLGLLYADSSSRGNVACRLMYLHKAALLP